MPRMLRPVNWSPGRGSVGGRGRFGRGLQGRALDRCTNCQHDQQEQRCRNQHSDHPVDVAQEPRSHSRGENIETYRLVLCLLDGMPYPQVGDRGWQHVMEFIGVLQHRFGQQGRHMLHAGQYRKSERERCPGQQPEDARAETCGPDAPGIVTRQHVVASRMYAVVHCFLMQEAADLLQQYRISNARPGISDSVNREPLSKWKADRRGVEHDFDPTTGRKPRAGLHRREVNQYSPADDDGRRSGHGYEAQVRGVKSPFTT